MGIGIKEEVAALGSKNVDDGFRQDVEFFVDGLPPTQTDPVGMPAQTTRLFSYYSLTASNVEEGGLLA